MGCVTPRSRVLTTISFLAIASLACSLTSGLSGEPAPAPTSLPAPTEVLPPTAVRLPTAPPATSIRQPTAPPLPATNTPEAAHSVLPNRQTISPQNVAELVSMAQLGLRAGGAGGVELQGLAWSPESKVLAASALVAQRFDVETLAELPLGETYGPVAFAPNGQLVTLIPDGSVQLWDSTTGELAREIEVDVFYSRGLAVSPDGQVVAAGTEFGGVYLWEASTGRLLETPLAHSGAVLSVAFSPDGRLLATGSADRTAVVYEQPGRQLYKLEHDDEVSSVAFSPDGGTLATFAFNIQWWDARDGRMLEQFPLDYSGEEAGATNVAFSPDGRLMAAGRCLPVAEFECTPEIIIWEVGGGWIHTLKYDTVSLGTPFGGSLLVAFSPDGRTLASADSARTLILWGVPGS
jgi:hypothetical protein